jgi:hypothetical protein
MFMNSDSASFDDSFLASNEDIVKFLAQMSAPRGGGARRVPDWVYGGFAEQTPAKAASSFPELPSEAQATPLPKTAQQVKPAARPLPGRAAVPGKVKLSRTILRQHCACGQCRWCLDNARWERIFNERFADPSYYGTRQPRHNSSLAGLR